MDWSLFAVFLATCCGAGASGVVFRPGEWYARLDKPGWTPPDWVFPVAWTTLYVAMALAAARVAPRDETGWAMAFWSLQIVLNTLWTPIFFGRRMLAGGIFVIVPLWIAVAATFLAFWPIDWLAGLLILPYLLWVSYATALNVSVWRRNTA